MAKEAVSKKPRKSAATSVPGHQFCFRAPAATSVQLVGDFTHWQRNPISMKKDAHGVWTTMVELLPGTYHYRFLVDGEWRDDPECTLRVTNPFGGYNAVRQVI